MYEHGLHFHTGKHNFAFKPDDCKQAGVGVFFTVLAEGVQLYVHQGKVNLFLPEGNYSSLAS
jgi:hypothetical protein